MEFKKAYGAIEGPDLSNSSTGSKMNETKINLENMNLENKDLYTSLNLDDSGLAEPNEVTSWPENFDGKTYFK